MVALNYLTQSFNIFEKEENILQIYEIGYISYDGLVVFYVSEHYKSVKEMLEFFRRKNHAKIKVTYPPNTMEEDFNEYEDFKSFYDNLIFNHADKDSKRILLPKMMGFYTDPEGFVFI